MTRHSLDIKFLFKIIITFLILGFLGKYVHDNWQTVLQVGSPEWQWVIIASLSALISILLSPMVYKSLVNAYGYKLSYSMILAVQSVSRFGKYIPGKVWAALLGVWFYNQAGIPKKIATASMLLISVFSILSAVIVISLGAKWIPISGFTTGISVLVLLLLIVIHPRIFYVVLNFGLRLIRRGEVSPTSIKYPLMLKIIMSQSVIWLFYGLGFYFLVRSYVPLSYEHLIPLISLFALAQITGLLAVVTPAGLGVREGVFLIGLIPIMGEGQAIVLVGFCRVWQTVLELLMSIIGLYIMKQNKLSILESKSQIQKTAS